MSHRENSSNLFDWLIKLAIILFMLPIFLDIFLVLDVGSNFFNSFLKILTAIVYIGSSIILIVLSKLTYRAFGFFGVLVACFYKLLESFIETGFSDKKGINEMLTVYILLITISLYFLSRSSKTHK